MPRSFPASLDPSVAMTNDDEDNVSAEAATRLDPNMAITAKIPMINGIKWKARDIIISFIRDISTFMSLHSEDIYLFDSIQDLRSSRI
ncbi:hypothetical protein [Xanthobacter sp. VNH20]|uniref:hypothetical protein n=1 Tax=Xanthobacter TaxID=279 RepID=UPI0032B57087